MDTEQLILTEIRDVRKAQTEQGRELGQINTRVAVIETSMEQINARLGDTKQTANGTADFTDDLDGRVEVLETWCNTFRGRASKLAWTLLAFALAQAGTWIAWLAMGRRK
jgi:archaellum component FlaC